MSQVSISYSPLVSFKTQSLSMPHLCSFLLSNPTTIPGSLGKHWSVIKKEHVLTWNQPSRACAIRSCREWWPDQDEEREREHGMTVDLIGALAIFSDTPFFSNQWMRHQHDMNAFERVVDIDPFSREVTLLLSDGLYQRIQRNVRRWCWMKELSVSSTRITKDRDDRWIDNLCWSWA